MTQPTNYTPTTDFSQQESINASGRSTVNTAALDAEFANIETTLDQTVSNLSLIQRDDGRLADLSVDVYTLTRQVLNLIGGYSLKGAWQPSTIYAEKDIVDNAGVLYFCVKSHTSPGSFVEDGNWSRFGFSGGEDAAASAAMAAISAGSADRSEAGSISAAADAAASAMSALSARSAAVSAQGAAASASGSASVSASNAANSASAAALSAASVARPIPISEGGTGATTAAAAIAALGGVASATLSASSGAAQVGTIQTGPGAVSRTTQEKMRESVSVKDFGAVGDGVTDDTSSIHKAIEYAATTGEKIYFPAGRYLVTSLISISNSNGNSIVLEGDFSDSSEIMLNTGGDGIVLNVSGSWWADLTSVSGAGVRLSHLRFSTNNIDVGTGLTIVGDAVAGRPRVPIVFDYVQFSSNTGASSYWSTATKILDAGMVIIHGSKWVASNSLATRSLYIDGTAADNSPVHFKLTSCEFTYGNKQIELGDFVEGVYITGCTMIAANYAVYWVPSSGESGLHVSNTHMASAISNVYLDNVFDFTVANCLLFRVGVASVYNGIHLNNGGRFAISGNVFCGQNDATFAESAVNIQSSVNAEKYGGIIAGNAFHSFASRAIWVGANANYVMVGINSYRECANHILNQQANNNNYVTNEKYQGNRTFTLVGGAATETIDISLPTGLFRTKPGSGFVTGTGTASSLVGTYDFDSASSTPTNARVTLRLLGGGVISAGSNRVSFLFSSDEDTSV